MLQKKLLVVVSITLAVAGLTDGYSLINREHYSQDDFGNTEKNYAQSKNILKDSFQMITEINAQTHKAKDLYEGDIMVKRPEEINIDADYEKRNAIRHREWIWQNRIIPYELPVDTYERASDRKEFFDAMDEISNKSCIRFVEHTNEKLWLKFVKKDGCWSYIGKTYISAFERRAQEISIGAGCISKGIIIHELLHALGFYHEQSRFDRDKYMEIFWENISPEDAHNFERKSQTGADTLGIVYDPSSIMHYGRDFFSINGQDTIVPINDVVIGQRDKLSAKDIIKLNLLYSCQSDQKHFWSSWTLWSPCDDKCIKIRQRFCTHKDKRHCPNADIYGVEKDEIKCADKECYAPIDGHWGRWGTWTECLAPCGSGTHTRSRTCDDPVPKHGGETCEGSSSSQGICYKPSCSLGPDDCDFEFGLCHWTSKNTKYEWKLNKGPTESRNTGPDGDHTDKKGNGQYIYAESSSPASAGDISILRSKIFPPTSHRSISFYYDMYGSSIGKLQVVMHLLTGETSVLWEKSGDQGNEWKKIEIDISSDQEYYIGFHAVRGLSFAGDIALDDIKFTDFSEITSREIITLPESNRKSEVIGCFADNGGTTRPFPELTNLRNRIDWHDISKTVVECANLALSKRYKYFGVEFYGECWYGENNQVNYQIDGPSQNCYQNRVGKSGALMVYRIVN